MSTRYEKKVGTLEPNGILPPELDYLDEKIRVGYKHATSYYIQNININYNWDILILLAGIVSILVGIFVESGFSGIQTEVITIITTGAGSTGLGASLKSFFEKIREPGKKLSEIFKDASKVVQKIDRRSLNWDGLSSEQQKSNINEILALVNGFQLRYYLN